VLPAKVMLINLLYLDFLHITIYDHMHHFIKCMLHETYFCTYAQQEQVLDALFWYVNHDPPLGDTSKMQETLAYLEVCSLLFE